MTEQHDVVIVGAGAAGLSAALTLGRACRRVLVIDAGEPRNRFAAHMHGVLGLEGIDPTELLRRGREEIAEYDVTIRPGTVDLVEDTDDAITVRLADGGTMSARILIAASGMTDVLPEVPGLAEHWGTSVLHCPYCHGWEVRGSRLGVLGSSPMSLHQAELLRQWSNDLTFFTAGCGDIPPEAAHRLRSRGVELIDVPVTKVHTRRSEEGDVLTGVRLDDGREIALDAIFTASIPRPHEEFLAGLGLDRVDSPMGNFIATDPTGRTSHPRIWAVGNVVNPGANVPISVGAGSFTAGMVNMALVTEDFDQAIVADHGHMHEHPEHRDTEHSDTGNRDDEDVTPADYWEGRYADSDRLWSGRVNATMADVIGGLEAGTALDLGCGEGGDAVWLAEQGWQVTAIDISSTATARGAEGAASRGVADRINWVAHDLTTWETEETFDLVTASFFHSTVDLSRTKILRRAAGRIRPGGHLLTVSHVFETDEDIPPWAWRHKNNHGDDQQNGHSAHPILLTPPEEIAELDLDTSEWQVVTEEIRTREATSPDGEQKAMVKDGVVLLQRIGGNQTPI